MVSLLERKLIVVTGKGGTGKTTVACALGLLAAQRGLRTIVVEVGDQHRLADLFTPGGSRSEFSERMEDDGHAPYARHDETVELQQRLWSMSIDPDRAMIDWLQTLTGRISARLLSSSSTFHYFAAAAPGAKELITMIELRSLCEGVPRRGRAGQPDGGRPYDLVVLDAPATGHALAMLRSPQTFAAIVRAGPLADQAQAVQELLGDSRRSGYVAVTHATEMAVSETLELEEGLRRGLDRDLDMVIVNGTLPRRFTREELARVARLDGGTASPDMQESQLIARRDPGEYASSTGRPEPVRASHVLRNAQVTHSAVLAARAVHERARVQQSQIARLRRQRLAAGHPPSMPRIPFVFTPALDLAAVHVIAERLRRGL